MNIGDKMKWNSKVMVGNDGTSHEVFTINASGRGWRSRLYFVLQTSKPSFAYNVIALETTKSRKNILVILVNDSNEALLEYAKNPYVRKDGTLNPNVQADGYASMKDAYGVIEYEKGRYWPKDNLIAWYGQAAYDLMEAYGDKVILAKVDL